MRLLIYREFNRIISICDSRYLPVDGAGGKMAQGAGVAGEWCTPLRD